MLINASEGIYTPSCRVVARLEGIVGSPYLTSDNTASDATGRSKTCDPRLEKYDYAVHCNCHRTTMQVTFSREVPTCWSMTAPKRCHRSRVTAAPESWAALTLHASIITFYQQRSTLQGHGVFMSPNSNRRHHTDLEKINVCNPREERRSGSFFHLGESQRLLRQWTG